MATKTAKKKALERIEKAERTGVKEFDLSGLGLETLPTSMS